MPAGVILRGALLLAHVALDLAVIEFQCYVHIFLGLRRRGIVAVHVDGNDLLDEIGSCLRIFLSQRILDATDVRVQEQDVLREHLANPRSRIHQE